MRSLKARLFATLFLTLAVSGVFAAPSGKPTRGSGVKPDLLYHNYCSVCHGDRGDGNSRAGSSLNPAPRNFTAAANLGREHMVAVIADGKPGTAMVGWSSQLSRSEIDGLTDYIRNTFMRVVLDPKVRRGKELYDAQCASCHGEKGEGRANPAIGMQTAPVSLASPQAREKWTRDGLIEIIKNGRSGTYMVSFRSKLGKGDVQNLVDYLEVAVMVQRSDEVSGTRAHADRTETPDRTPPVSMVDFSATFPNGLAGNAAKGKKFFLDNCSACHGAKGDGQGPRAYFINPRPASFIAPKYKNSLNRPALFASIAHGKLGSEMPAWSKVLTDQEIADVAEYVFEAYIRSEKSAAKPKP